MAFKLKDIIRGNTRAINLTFTQTSGTPHDLTGATVFFAVTATNDPADDAAALIDITPVTVHTDAALGQTQIVLSPTQTRITPGTYNCGAQAVLADGTVIEEVGTVKIKTDYKVSIT